MLESIWFWVGLGTVAYLLLGLAVLYILCVVSPGGAENNFAWPSNSEDRWFMAGAALLWPYWLVMIIVASRQGRL